MLTVQFLDHENLVQPFAQQQDHLHTVQWVEPVVGGMLEGSVGGMQGAPGPVGGIEVGVACRAH